MAYNNASGEPSDWPGFFENHTWQDNTNNGLKVPEHLEHLLKKEHLKKWL
jgi:hypothetical protein